MYKTTINLCDFCLCICCPNRDLCAFRLFDELDYGWSKGTGMRGDHERFGDLFMSDLAPTSRDKVTHARRPFKSSHLDDGTMDAATFNGNDLKSRVVVNPINDGTSINASRVGAII